MADIKQAAKWMKEGKAVRCKGWVNKQYAIRDDDNILVPNTAAKYGASVTLGADDLLADDWEIA